MVDKKKNIIHINWLTKYMGPIVKSSLFAEIESNSKICFNSEGWIRCGRRIISVYK